MAIFTSIDTKEILTNDRVLCDSIRKVCLDVCFQMCHDDNDDNTVELLLTDRRFENDFEQTVLFTVMHHVWPDYRFKIENQHLIRIKQGDKLK